MGGVPLEKAELEAASKEVGKVGCVWCIAEWFVSPSFYSHLGTGCIVSLHSVSVTDKEEGAERHSAA